MSQENKLVLRPAITEMRISGSVLNRRDIEFRLTSEVVNPITNWKEFIPGYDLKLSDYRKNQYHFLVLTKSAAVQLKNVLEIKSEDTLSISRVRSILDVYSNDYSRIRPMHLLAELIVIAIALGKTKKACFTIDRNNNVRSLTGAVPTADVAELLKLCSEEKGIAIFEMEKQFRVAKKVVLAALGIS